MSPLCSTRKYLSHLPPWIHILYCQSIIWPKIESKRRIETLRVSFWIHSSKSPQRKVPHCFPEMAKEQGCPLLSNSTQGIYWWWYICRSVIYRYTSLGCSTLEELTNTSALNSTPCFLSVSMPRRTSAWDPCPVILVRYWLCISCGPSILTPTRNLYFDNSAASESLIRVAFVWRPFDTIAPRQPYFFWNSTTLAKKVQAHKRRFSALPTKIVDWLGGVHIACNYLLKHFIIHTMTFCCRINSVLFKIEAVVAIQVAVCRGGFYKKGKRFG